MIPKSIEAYPDECAAVLSWLTAQTWLHQNDFDQRSWDWRLDKNRPQRVHKYTGETIILPFECDPLIAIVQELMRNDIVQARETADGCIEYKLTRS